MVQRTPLWQKILVVDDESLIRYSLTMMLQREGVEVTSAATGAAALSEIHRRFYDICFLDIHLPDMNGFSILKELRQVSPGTVVIVMSGCENEEEYMKELNKGHEHFLAKPFDLFQVKSFVDSILSKSAAPVPATGHVLKNYDALVDRISGRPRKHERKPIAKRVTCVGSITNVEEEAHVFDADLIDISEGGFGFLVEHEVRPGHILNVFDHAECCQGVVRWCRPLEDPHRFRAGMQFLAHGEPQDLDEFRSPS